MENAKVITSETMVTLYTWESERGAPQVRIVPLPFAERASLSGFYYGTKAVSESGAVLWDSRED